MIAAAPQISGGKADRVTHLLPRRDDTAGAVVGQRPAVQGRTLCSVFFGGGTPSLISPRAIGGLLESISALVPLEIGAEITLEPEFREKRPRSPGEVRAIEEEAAAAEIAEEQVLRD